jgi:LysM repeat protein
VGKIIWITKALVILVLSTVIFGSAGYFAYQLFIEPNRMPPEEAAYRAPPPPPDPSLPDLAKAIGLQKERKWVEARSALEAFLINFPYSTKLQEAKTALGQVNIDIFFSSVPAPEKIRYEVKKGDALAKIERKLKISREVLMRCNNLDDPRRLSIGQILYISPSEFSVVISRKEHTLTLLNHYRFFKEYKAVSWNAPAPRKGMEKVPLEAKVRGKMAWSNDGLVSFGSKEYAESARWVETTLKGFTLYTEGGRKPEGGIGFSPEEMQELSTLLTKNVPVSIQ